MLCSNDNWKEVLIQPGRPMALSLGLGVAPVCDQQPERRTRHAVNKTAVQSR